MCGKEMMVHAFISEKGASVGIKLQLGARNFGVLWCSRMTIDNKDELVYFKT